MPQNEYIEETIKRHGRRLDYEERKRKREAREHTLLQPRHRLCMDLKPSCSTSRDILKRYRCARPSNNMKQRMSLLQTRIPKMGSEPLPPYLLDRQDGNRAKALSSMVKQKRKEKAGKWSVPIPSVRGVAQDEVFKVVKTGKRQQKAWKRMITKPTFVGEGFTRKPPKFERFIRPMGLRMKKANVTHPELKTTFQLPIIGVKEKSSRTDVHSTGCADQRNNSGGECLRTGIGDYRRKDRMGKVCSNNKQP